MKITKRHIQHLTEQRVKLNLMEKEYPEWMSQYPESFFWKDEDRDAFLKKHPTWKPDYESTTTYPRSDDFIDPTQGGDRKVTYTRNGRGGDINLKYKPVIKYQYDARTKKDKEREMSGFGKPSPKYGSTDVIQVDRPEGKRFYAGSGDSPFKQGDRTSDAQWKAQYTPADSVSTQKMQNWIDKKQFDLGPEWDMFNKK